MKGIKKDVATNTTGPLAESDYANCLLTPDDTEVTAADRFLRDPCMFAAGKPLLVVNESMCKDEVRILYMRTGAARVLLTNAENAAVRAVALKAGQMLVVFPGSKLMVKLTEDTGELLSVVLAMRRGSVRTLLRMGCWDLLHMAKCRKVGDAVSALIARFEAVPASNRRCDAQVRSMVVELLNEVWGCMLSDSTRRSFYKNVRKLNQYLCANSDEDAEKNREIETNKIARGHWWTTDDCANALGVKRTKLNTMFEKGMKQRPGAYVKRVIVALAQTDLLRTYHSVAEIAGKYGYSDLMTFATFFRRHVGQSPTEFRQDPLRSDGRATKANNEIGKNGSKGTNKEAERDEMIKQCMRELTRAHQVEQDV